jgi:hypothetical protein
MGTEGNELTSGIWIEGASASERAAMREAAERALEFLDAEDEALRIEIGHPPDAPPGTDCGANERGVWIRRESLGRGPRLRVQFLIYEEVAHYVIARRGLPHAGGAGMIGLLQELFAGYVQYSLLVRHHAPHEIAAINFYPIHGAEPRAFYEVGKHIGLAVAGRPAAHVRVALSPLRSRTKPSVCRPMTTGTRVSLSATRVERWIANE